MRVDYSVLELADAILEYNKKDIRRFDNITDLNIYYKRSFGFSFEFNFRGHFKQNIFSFRMNFGGVETSFKYQMNETPIKQVEIFDTMWYLEFIRSLVTHLPIKYAVVRPRDTNYLQNAVTKYRYPLGLLTYFKNDVINSNLLINKPFSQEVMGCGTLYYISREFFENSEGLEMLYGIMNEIGKSDQNYLL